VADPHDITPGERMLAGALAGASAQVSLGSAPCHSNYLFATTIVNSSMLAGALAGASAQVGPASAPCCTCSHRQR
jgi:hypothetical protein